MPTYIERPKEYQARQFVNTPDAIPELAEWLHHGWQITAYLVTPAFTPGQVGVFFEQQTYLEAFFTSRRADGFRGKVNVGDWIVWDMYTQTWAILSDAEFRLKYMPNPYEE